MMVVWGNQKFSAIRAYTVTVAKEIVNSMDMNTFSFFILLFSIYMFSLISPTTSS